MVDLFTTYILASLSHKYLTLVSVLMASLEHLYFILLIASLFALVLPCPRPSWPAGLQVILQLDN